jgi:hypothetical protein
VAVVGEGVAEDDIADILPLDEHVRLADGIGLGVQLLPEHGEAGFRVVLLQIIVGDRQHAPGSRGRVVDGADHAGLR